jgi:hypothetical protein
MKGFMRIIAHYVVMLVFLTASVAVAQEWELGVAGGFGFTRNPAVTNTLGSGNAGLKNGFTAGVVAGNDMYDRLSGEFHYLYRVSELKVSGGGQEAGFSGESHLVHYDLVYHLADRGDRRIRPFIAGGGGVRVYRGTDVERSYQPANKFALLTKTQETKPLVSAGGGVKITLTDSLHLRVEARDYMTPFPKQVIAPSPGSRIKGWLHDIVPTVGIGVSF